MRTILILACLLIAGLSFAPSSAAVVTEGLALQATPPSAPTAPPVPTAPPMPTTPPVPTPPAAPTMPAMPTTPPVPGTPTMSPATTPSPMSTPTVLMLPPNAAPKILWVRLSSTTPQAGDALDVTVLTSSNVASVELRVGGYGASMSKTDVGHFEMTSTVPRLPFFMSHNLTLQVIARNSAGIAAQQSVPLQVH